jgi:RNA polymerase sigma factor (sigma-70 family)
VSDTELIERFLKGDPGAVRTIQDWVREVVQARVWIRGVSAEDIASDTMLKLLLALREDKFRFESSLKTYAQRIARFTIVDSIRNHRRALEYARQAAYEEKGTSDPEDPFESAEEFTLFQRVMSLAGDECRALWGMIFQESLDYSEIARKLKISVGAVKTRVFRCKKKAIDIGKKLG